MRSYDLVNMVNSECYDVQLARPIQGCDPEFSKSLNLIEEWLDDRCEGTYVILLTSVVFKSGADALLFKLKYG